MASIHRRTVRWSTQDGDQRTGQRWQAVYVGEDRKEHTKLMALKNDAQSWLDQQTANPIRADWTDPAAGKETLRTYPTGWARTRSPLKVPADSAPAAACATWTTKSPPGCKAKPTDPPTHESSASQRPGRT